jgi:hypothetical protein
MSQFSALHYRIAILAKLSSLSQILIQCASNQCASNSRFGDPTPVNWGYLLNFLEYEREQILQLSKFRWQVQGCKSSEKFLGSADALVAVYIAC